jgi:hypothetical protein
MVVPIEANINWTNALPPKMPFSQVFGVKNPVSGVQWGQSAALVDRRPLLDRLAANENHISPAFAQERRAMLNASKTLFWCRSATATALTCDSLTCFKFRFVSSPQLS